MSVELVVRGHSLSPGIAQGALWILRNERGWGFDRARITGKSARLAEVERFQIALEAARRQLIELRRRESKKPVAEILDAHLELTRDPLLLGTMEVEIRDGGQRACFALKKTLGEILKVLKGLPARANARERASDFKDICHRIGRFLDDRRLDPWHGCPPGSIVACQEMLPSVFAQGLTRALSGLITQIGGENSHVAIMARSQGIPYLSRIALPTSHRRSSLPVIVDADRACLIINSSKNTVDFTAWQTPRREGLKSSAHTLKRVHSLGGIKLEIAGNAESAEQVCQLVRGGVSSIGLFRSEVLAFKHRGFPPEPLQRRFYRELCEAAEGRSLTIRLFDLGGDKVLDPARQAGRSALSHRGIRYLLRHRGQLRRQLRAIASLTHRPLSILVPMVSGAEDLMAVQEELSAAWNQVGDGEIPMPKLGCMLEIPSATFVLDQLAPHCDFFSLGTNDLCQYLFAMDRNHPQSGHHLPFHPALLRLIEQVVRESKRLKRPITICGEMCSDSLLFPVLVGLGIRKFSVSPAKLTQLGSLLRGDDRNGAGTLARAEELARYALRCATIEEVRELLQDWARGNDCQSRERGGRVSAAAS